MAPGPERKVLVDRTNTQHVTRRHRLAHEAETLIATEATVGPSPPRIDFHAQIVGTPAGQVTVQEGAVTGLDQTMILACWLRIGRSCLKHDAVPYSSEPRMMRLHARVSSLSIVSAYNQCFIP